MILFGINKGPTWSLTNSFVTGLADNIAGTSGDDTFSATAPSALNTGDILKGNGGTDTLNADVSNLNEAVITPILTGIAQLNLTNSAAALGTLDLSNSTGYTGILVQNLNTAGGNVLVQSIASTSVKLAVQNVDNSASLGNTVTFQFQNSAVSGSADSADLTVNSLGLVTGGVKPTITLQGGPGSTSGVETINLHVTACLSG